MDLSMDELNTLYAAAYKEGHHDTVEGQYVDVLPVDYPTYHHDSVAQLLDDLEVV